VSRSHVKVRPAEAADVAALVELVGATDLWPTSPRARRLRAESEAALPCRLAEIIADPGRTVLVALEEGSGELAGLIVLGEDEVAALTATPVISVTHLAVSPGHRRRGVARTLLAAAVQAAAAREIDYVMVSAIAGSREVNRYFARLGFAPLVVRRVAPTAVLRRSLGMAEPADRVAALRRTRGRESRPRLVTRPIRRGA